MLCQAPGWTSWVTSSLASWSAKKNIAIRPQVQGAATKLDQTFEVEETKQCKIVELVVSPIVEEVEEEIIANLRADYKQQ